MKLIKPSHCFEKFIASEILMSIELAGRVCYKSEEFISSDSSEKFIKKIIKSGHESVLEHEKITARVVCDRGVTHEIVRHRIASYSQESTRYCNYGGGVTFIIPPWVEDVEPGEYENHYFSTPDEATNDWLCCLWNCEKIYKDLILADWSPQKARTVLPNSLKTEIVMTMNLREWRHFFKLRTASAAHPQMQEIAKPMLFELKKALPIIFKDIVLI